MREQQIHIAILISLVVLFGFYIIHLALQTKRMCPKCGSKLMKEHDISGIVSQECIRCKYRKLYN